MQSADGPRIGAEAREPIANGIADGLQLPEPTDPEGPIANGLQRGMRSFQGPGLDTKTPPAPAPIARLHANQGHGGKGVEHRTPDSSAAYALSLAVALEYPRLDFQPGETIMAGARNWGLFLRRAEPDAIAAVELEKEKLVVLGQVVPGVGCEDLKSGMEMELVLETLFEDDDNEYLVWKWKPAAAA